jgi:hypothetical protein
MNPRTLFVLRSAGPSGPRQRQKHISTRHAMRMTAQASGAGTALATPEATFAAVRTDTLHLRRVEPGCRHVG